MHTGLKILKFIICFVLINFFIFLIYMMINYFKIITMQHRAAKVFFSFHTPVLTKKVWSRYNINDIELYIYKHVRFYITWDAADGCSLVLSVYFVFIFIMFNTHSFGPSPNYIIMICIYMHMIWYKIWYYESSLHTFLVKYDPSYLHLSFK